MTPEVLPDSGTNILAAGKEVLQHLKEQVNFISSAVVILKAMDGTKLYPLGRISVYL